MGGKKKKAGNKSETLDEDALLEQAIAENNVIKAELAAKQKEQAASEAKARASMPELKTLSMADTLTKLDRVQLFFIFRMLDDGSKDACPSPNGDVNFYLDAEDVQADMRKLQEADSTLRLGVDHTPLGRAFALTQGLMGLQCPARTRLLFSRRVVKVEGDACVPPAVRDRMKHVGPFPLFYSDKINVQDCTPVFFSREDMAEFFLSVGGDPNAIPEPIVTDLRILVSRTLQEPGIWAPLRYVPPKNSATLRNEVRQRAERDQRTADGFAKGAQRMRAVQHAMAVADGDEPPPLASDSGAVSVS